MSISTITLLDACTNADHRSSLRYGNIFSRIQFRIKKMSKVSTHYKIGSKKLHVWNLFDLKCGSSQCAMLSLRNGILRVAILTALSYI